MSVRKRRWRSPSGEMKETWVVDYTDQAGARHLKTFIRRVRDRGQPPHAVLPGRSGRTFSALEVRP